MSKKLTLASLFAGLMLTASPAFAYPPSRCQCSGGIDRDNRSIPVSETYCGYKTCGLGNVQWECTESGWKNLGNCGSYPPECSSGADQWGKPIHPNTTFLNYETCGTVFTQRYYCGSGGNWVQTTPGCTFCELCRCHDGRDPYNNIIPAGSTSCGQAAYGLNWEKWQCTAGGWEKYSTGGATNNSKLGVNTAVFLDTSKETTGQGTAQTYRMGWYQMMIGDQSEENQIDWRIATPIQNARNRGLTTILRLCTGGGYCNYTDHADRLVQILNNTYLRDAVTGPWFVIAGPNEPPAEKWMTTTTKGMTPACANGTYCDSQLDTIANEMANFADYVMDYMNPAHRQPTGDIGLLSPVWDCHNTTYTPTLMAKLQQKLQARGRSMSQFDGIAINAYNLHGQKATYYINQCKAWLQQATGTSSYNYYVTETGMLEADAAPPAGNGNGVPGALARDNLRELVKVLRGDASIKAALFFNATGRNSDPAFRYNILNQSCEWQYVTGGHSQL